MQQFDPFKKKRRKEAEKKFGFRFQINRGRKSNLTKEEKDDKLGKVKYIDGIKHIEIKKKK